MKKTTSLRGDYHDDASERESLDGSHISRDASAAGNQAKQLRNEGVTELRDAIIELYLAIKIRSTEEVSAGTLWTIIVISRSFSYVRLIILSFALYL